MRKARIVIAPEMRPYPAPRELEVAGILVKFLETRQIREVIVIRKDGSLIHLKK